LRTLLEAATDFAFARAAAGSCRWADDVAGKATMASATPKMAQTFPMGNTASFNTALPTMFWARV
jgi:hypothetical protein